MRADESELESYERSLRAWARQQFARRGLPFSEEELIRRMRQEAGLPLEAFLPELERIAQGP